MSKKVDYSEAIWGTLIGLVFMSLSFFRFYHFYVEKGKGNLPTTELHTTLQCKPYTYEQVKPRGGGVWNFLSFRINNNSYINLDETLISDLSDIEKNKILSLNENDSAVLYITDSTMQNNIKWYEAIGIRAKDFNYKIAKNRKMSWELIKDLIGGSIYGLISIVCFISSYRTQWNFKNNIPDRDE